MTAAQTAEDAAEYSLRPQTLREYIGQKKAKGNLSVFIQAAKMRGEPLDHVLLHGPPTRDLVSLSNIIANEMGVHIRITSGPAIEKPGDLAALLTNLNENDILFVDEIHRLNRSVEEILYPAMEDFAIDIIIGKGPSANSIRLDLPHFTLVGATTPAGSSRPPLAGPVRGDPCVWSSTPPRSSSSSCSARRAFWRCPLRTTGPWRLPGAAGARPALPTGCSGGCGTLPRCGRGASSRAAWPTRPSPRWRWTNWGWTPSTGGCSGASSSTTAAAPWGWRPWPATINEEAVTLEDVYEPYLMQMGFLTRTPRGRCVTPQAYRHLGLAVPGGMDLEQLTL